MTTKTNSTQDSCKMQPLAFGLFASTTPEGIEISGKTFDNRERLKLLGAKWNKETKVWVLPLTTDLHSLEQVAHVKPRQKVFRTWVCGNKTAKIDPRDPHGPMIWVCSCCGTYKSDYDGT